MTPTGPKPQNATKVFVDIMTTFSQAFATARCEGWPLFVWRGEKYTTRRADDSATPET